MVRTYCHHNGRLCLYQIRFRSFQTSACPEGCFCFHCSGLYRCGNCGDFRCASQQKCAGSRWSLNKINGGNKMNSNRHGNDPDKIGNESGPEIPNGAAAAAILSAGVGCFSVSVFGLLGDAFPTLAHFFNFYNPTGPLSGVTTTAIMIWLMLWAILCRSWGGRSFSMGKINTIA